jgi:hypothetical protein
VIAGVRLVSQDQRLRRVPSIAMVAASTARVDSDSRGVYPITDSIMDDLLGDAAERIASGAWNRSVKGAMKTHSIPTTFLLVVYGDPLNT